LDKTGKKQKMLRYFLGQVGTVGTRESRQEWGSLISDREMKIAVRRLQERPEHFTASTTAEWLPGMILTEHISYDRRTRERNCVGCHKATQPIISSGVRPDGHG
jgi:hypothetical protein